MDTGFVSVPIIGGWETGFVVGGCEEDLPSTQMAISVRSQRGTWLHWKYGRSIKLSRQIEGERQLRAQRCHVHVIWAELRAVSLDEGPGAFMWEVKHVSGLMTGPCKHREDRGASLDREIKGKGHIYGASVRSLTTLTPMLCGDGSAQPAPED